MRTVKANTRTSKGSSSRSSDRLPRRRIGLVEPEPLRVVGIQAALARSRTFEVVVTTIEVLLKDRSIALGLLAQHEGADIRPVLALLRQTRPDLKILVLGACIQDKNVIDLFQNGVHGFVDETCSIRELRLAIRTVVSGLSWAPQKLRPRLTGGPRKELANRAPQGFRATHREGQILDHLVQARSNREIANQLGIEERTVKSHIARLMRKAEVDNRTALSLFALNRYK
jgi:DNA-binding NarL/FixJ family response regulator